MTLQKYIDETLGKIICYPAGQYCGECLSLAKDYIKKRYGINPPPSGSGSAYGYWSNFPNPLSTIFKKVANTPTGVPKAGDIMIWGTGVGKYGHISIFVEGTASSFRSFDQNWGGRQAHIQGHYYNNVVGWLTPKQITGGNMTAKVYENNGVIWLYFHGVKYAYKSPEEYLADGWKWGDVTKVSTLPQALNPEQLVRDLDIKTKEINLLKETNHNLQTQYDNMFNQLLSIKKELDELQKSYNTLAESYKAVKNKQCPSLYSQLVDWFKNYIKRFRKE